MLDFKERAKTYASGDMPRNHSVLSWPKVSQHLTLILLTVATGASIPAKLRGAIT